MEYKLIDLPKAYHPKGALHKKGKPKGFNKALYLYNSGLRDYEAIRLLVISHYYANANQRALKGKKRQYYMNTRRNQLKQAIAKLKTMKHGT